MLARCAVERGGEEHLLQSRPEGVCDCAGAAASEAV